MLSNWQRIAKRRWPKADWIRGDGEWATVADCKNLTIQLNPTRVEAETAKAQIDKTACGSRCRRNHKIVHLA